MHRSIRTLTAAALAGAVLTAASGCSEMLVNRQPDNHKAMEQLIERQPGVHTADVKVNRSVNGITTKFDVVTRVGLNSSVKIRDEAELIKWLWDVSKQTQPLSPYSETIIIEDRRIDARQVFADLDARYDTVHLDYDPLLSIDDTTGGIVFTVWDADRDYDNTDLPGNLPAGVLTY